MEGSVRARLRVVLSAIGLGIALYLTVVHYATGVPLVCSNTGAVDCEQVLTSPQSVWFGLPVAAWGLLWFAVALGLGIAVLGSGRPAWVRNASVGWALVGAATVIVLVYNELVVIGKICLWCTAVHVLVLALLVLEVA